MLAEVTEWLFYIKKHGVLEYRNLSKLNEMIPGSDCRNCETVTFLDISQNMHSDNAIKKARLHSFNPLLITEIPTYYNISHLRELQLPLVVLCVT